jgi:hypothetical protein
VYYIEFERNLYKYYEQLRKLWKIPEEEGYPLPRVTAIGNSFGPFTHVNYKDDDSITTQELSPEWGEIYDRCQGYSPEDASRLKSPSKELCLKCLNEVPPRNEDEIPYFYTFTDGLSKWIRDSRYKTKRYGKVILGPKRPNIQCNCLVCRLIECEHATGPSNLSYKFPE